MAGRAPLLTELPDPCLLAVLCCAAADDQRSLFSAARAHSRLHQAAVAALGSITADVYRQQLADGVLLYLGKHGQHIHSVSLGGPFFFFSSDRILSQLPSHLRLSSLQLSWFYLELQPGGGFRDLLGAATGVAALKQLRLHHCTLLETGDGLEAALLQLPAGLEHLSVSHLHNMLAMGQDGLPTAMLQPLQQLTYLELAETSLQGPDRASPALQPLQSLTRLVDLRLTTSEEIFGRIEATASMLSGMHHLTCLMLSECHIEPGVLAGKTQLQHLHLASCDMFDGAAGRPSRAGLLGQFLSHLQQLQQLIHLVVQSSLQADWTGPPAAAYSALTASSKLQHLDISDCILSAGVWQHVFPAGRQLPHLQSLDISWTKEPFAHDMAAPEGTRLVSCCPSLRSLGMETLQVSAELLAQLRGLSGLHTLRLGADDPAAAEGLEEVCQLTGLRELHVARAKEGLLLQLTQLKQLTALTYDGRVRGAVKEISLANKAPGDEPVWRQLLRLHLDHSDPEVAQQAAAALAD